MAVKPTEEFDPVLAVSSILSALSVPWWITGGWAVDLAVGRRTRRHEDIDVMLLERDERALRTDLNDVELQLLTGPQNEQEPWPADRRPMAGPDRVHIRSPKLSVPIEVQFGAAVGRTWVYHRGRPGGLTRSLADLTKERFGIPFTAPEVVLMLKCMDDRKRDEQDLNAVLPVLNEEQRRWLADAANGRSRAARWQAGSSAAGEVGQHPWSSRLIARDTTGWSSR
jgi:hypothetical protein